MTAGTGVLLDTISPHPTPEGCELDLRIAGPMVRVLAWAFDAVLRLTLWLALVQAFVLLGTIGIGLVLVSGFLIEWLLPVVFEVRWRGQTPGKRILHLAVVHDDGTPVSWEASLARNTLRFVDFLPLFYATGFVSMLMTRESKRLGDLVAGTVVVHLGEAERSLPVPAGSGVEAPPFPLTLEEQRAVVEFCRRAPTLTDERAEELASTAGPLVAGLRPEEAVARLQRIGRFLIGTR